MTKSSTRRGEVLSRLTGERRSGEVGVPRSLSFAFGGVIRYLDMGGQLRGDQYEYVRKMIAATYALKIRDKALIRKREALIGIL